MLAVSKYHRQHPETTQRRDVLLWSINERLAGRAGVDVPFPSLEWTRDLTDLVEYEAEQREAEEERRARVERDGH